MFASLGHFFTAVGKTIVQGARKLASDTPEIAAVANAAKLPVEAISAAVFPAAVPFEELAFRFLGQGLQAVHDGGDAVSQAGINVPLDITTVNEFKALIAQLEAAASQMGVQKPVATVAATAAAATAIAAVPSIPAFASEANQGIPVQELTPSGKVNTVWK